MINRIIDGIVSGFDKHLVCLAFRDSTVKPERYYSYSAFLISINGVWALVTAGHNIAEIDKALAAGHELDAWHIDDAIGRDRAGNHPVPFHFDRSQVICVNSEEHGWDYALLGLHWLTVQQLRVYVRTRLHC